MIVEYLVNVKKLTSACLDRSLFTFENWGQYARDFLNLAGNDQYSVRFDNQVQVFLRPNTSDKWVLQETMLQDDYRLKSLNLKGATVLDLGGNIGVVSISAAMQGAARVFTYEPAPANFELLMKNVSHNRLQGVVRAFNMAVSDADKPLQFFLDRDNPSGNSMYARRGTAITVQSTSVPRIFEEHGIETCDLMKMDIEGAEFPILYTLAPQWFARIKRLYVEVHKGTEPRHNVGDLMAYLQQQGYRVEKEASLDWRISRLFCERS